MQQTQHFGNDTRDLTRQPPHARAYLVGGGIASLATAILLIRDAHWRGSQIQLFEASGVLGGSLDGSGNPVDGYVIRGGRMFEEHFGCTFDLLRDIPTLDNPDLSVTEEIIQFSREVVTSSNCRLVVDGQRVEAPAFGLSLIDKRKLILLTQKHEGALGNKAIEDYFSPAFFESNFWLMWSTMFAFQRWHSLVECRRYMRRFMHLLPGFNRLEGIHRTRLNQYDSIIRPCVRWLEARGVSFHLNTPVTDVAFTEDRTQVSSMEYLCEGQAICLDIASEDRVFATLGSMTEATSQGTMSSPPPQRNEPNSAGSWALWRRIASQSGSFGNPAAFASDTDKTLWVSFTVTLTNPEFFRAMEQFTGNAAGTGGLVTFKHSGWTLSVVLAYQPHFANQPEDIYVFWGYGLHSAEHGDTIAKPMFECSGEEILQELSHHLQLSDTTAQRFFEGANCIPCHMPYITAQFMPRNVGDRPQVIPQGAVNYAFLGQFCEVPDDTVFTVEYSVRTAQEAVYGSCGTQSVPTQIYKSFSRPEVIARALKTIAGNGTSTI